MIFVLLNNLKLFIILSIGAKSNKMRNRLHTIAVVKDIQYLAGINIMDNLSIKAKDCDTAYQKSHPRTDPARI